MNVAPSTNTVPSVNTVPSTNRPKVDASKVVDTAGAGDSFLGALGYFLCRNTPLATAVQNAVTVAGYSVQAKGTQSSYPSRDALPASLF